MPCDKFGTLRYQKHMLLSISIADFVITFFGGWGRGKYEGQCGCYGNEYTGFQPVSLGKLKHGMWSL